MLRFRLRPSVALVPLQVDDDIAMCEFFMGNTRRTFRFALERWFFELLARLGGEESLPQALESLSSGATRDVGWLEDALLQLEEKCLVERVDVAARVEKNPFRGTLNFLLDYFPSSEVFGAFDKMQATVFVVVGLGGVGSWVVQLLAESGATRFVLVDSDCVELSNLNRSVFGLSDVGRCKVDSMRDRLLRWDPELRIDVHRALIESKEQLKRLVGPRDNEHPFVFASCGDFPSADEVARCLASLCMELRAPHVIAGGYNQHLSLIGPTIIPFKTACFECMRLGLDGLAPPEFRYVEKLARPDRKMGSLGPVVANAASFAAMEALRVSLAGPRLLPAMANRRAELNFVTGDLHFVDLPAKGDCTWCGGFDS